MIKLPNHSASSILDEAVLQWMVKVNLTSRERTVVENQPLRKHEELIVTIITYAWRNTNSRSAPESDQDWGMTTQ